jgi:hypothetical protein
MSYSVSITTTGPKEAMKHGARSWVCSTVSRLLGLVGFAKGEKLPEGLPDGTAARDRRC